MGNKILIMFVIFFIVGIPIIIFLSSLLIYNGYKQFLITNEPKLPMNAHSHISAVINTLVFYTNITDILYEYKDQSKFILNACKYVEDPNIHDKVTFDEIYISLKKPEYRYTKDKLLRKRAGIIAVTELIKSIVEYHIFHLLLVVIIHVIINSL
jgi:hypothetical protein